MPRSPILLTPLRGPSITLGRPRPPTLARTKNTADGRTDGRTDELQFCARAFNAPMGDHRTERQCAAAAAAGGHGPIADLPPAAFAKTDKLPTWLCLTHPAGCRRRPTLSPDQRDERRKEAHLKRGKEGGSRRRRRRREITFLKNALTPAAAATTAAFARCSSLALVFPPPSGPRQPTECKQGLQGARASESVPPA